MIRSSVSVLFVLSTLIVATGCGDDTVKKKNSSLIRDPIASSSVVATDQSLTLEIGQGELANSSVALPAGSLAVGATIAVYDSEPRLSSALAKSSLEVRPSISSYLIQVGTTGFTRKKTLPIRRSWQTRMVS